jgi:hypothetical protein
MQLLQYCPIVYVMVLCSRSVIAASGVKETNGGGESRLQSRGVGHCTETSCWNHLPTPAHPALVTVIRSVTHNGSVTNHRIIAVVRSVTHNYIVIDNSAITDNSIVTNNCAGTIISAITDNHVITNNGSTNISTITNNSIGTNNCFGTVISSRCNNSTVTDNFIVTNNSIIPNSCFGIIISTITNNIIVANNITVANNNIYINSSKFTANITTTSFFTNSGTCTRAATVIFVTISIITIISATSPSLFSSSSTSITIIVVVTINTATFHFFVTNTDIVITIHSTSICYALPTIGRSVTVQGSVTDVITIIDSTARSDLIHPGCIVSPVPSGTCAENRS